MCEPITLGLMAAGTLLKAGGELQAGAENKRIADKNAQMADYAAIDAEKRGSATASLARMKAGKMVSTQRALTGASGMDVSKGSPQQVMDETQAMGELDAQTIKNNAAREAWGYRTQGADFRAQGEAAQKASQFGAASTVLGGAMDFGPRAWKLMK